MAEDNPGVSSESKFAAYISIDWADEVPQLGAVPGPSQYRGQLPQELLALRSQE